MPKKKSIVPIEILDRMKNMGTWDQAKTEARLQVSRLEGSIAYFKEQKRSGAEYPKPVCNQR